jgi:hypothetical protein
MSKYKFCFSTRTDEWLRMAVADMHDTWRKALGSSDRQATVFYVYEGNNLVGIIPDTTRLDRRFYEELSKGLKLSYGHYVRYYGYSFALWKVLNEHHRWHSEVDTYLEQEYLKHALSNHQTTARLEPTGAENTQSGD